MTWADVSNAGAHLPAPSRPCVSARSKSPRDKEQLWGTARRSPAARTAEYNFTAPAAPDHKSCSADPEPRAAEALHTEPPPTTTASSTPPASPDSEQPNPPTH